MYTYSNNSTLNYS